MLEQQPEDWPHLLLFVGDQVYADDSSPGTRERVRARRGHLEGDDDQPSLTDVADFEEYTWLYHESWLPEVERWVLSVVPSAMIFDDHDMIDDWNTSWSWVEDIRAKPWWQTHVTGGLMSYWIYQHLGNLSPERIREEGMLERFVEMGDASDALRDWAERAEEFTPVPGRYRFSYRRDLGPVRIVVIDSRNGRVLTPGARQMVHDDEWQFVREAAAEPCQHLVLATSIPAVMPGGLHELERWNELVSEGAWGRWFVPLGEKVRRALDLEDWAAFHDSYLRLMELLREVATPREASVATPREAPSPDPPATVTIVSGDVHFSFRATATFPDEAGRPRPTSRVYQVVNSPIRNVLATRERRAMQLGLSRVGKWVGRALRRSAGARRDEVAWNIDEGPFFANHICLLEFTDRDGRMLLERAHPGDGGGAVLSVVADASL
jgi:hypothetical protein